MITEDELVNAFKIFDKVCFSGTSSNVCSIHHTMKRTRHSLTGPVPSRMKTPQWTLVSNWSHASLVRTRVAPSMPLSSRMSSASWGFPSILCSRSIRSSELRVVTVLVTVHMCHFRAPLPFTLPFDQKLRPDLAIAIGFTQPLL